MARTFPSTRTAQQATHEALKNREGDMAPPTVDEIAEDSSKRAAERMKKNEDAQGIFTK